MRNLKKVLSLVLCVAMMLSVMVVGAGAAFSDQSKIKNTEAVDACTALNIIGGYPDGSFKPEGNITRAEVTKMICVALNGGKEPNLATNATPTFSDVRTNANSAWAEKYIESCYAQGIVSGVGGGKFAPAGNVTGTQLAKMLLVSLGYNPDIEKFTGNAWATNVNIIATQKGLYEGLESIDVSAALTRDNAAQMLWNAVKADEVKYEYTLVSENGQLVSKTTLVDKKDGNSTDNLTFLKDKYNVTIVKDAILTKISADDKGTYNVTTTGTKGKSYTKVAKDYSELMGQEVDVLVKDNDSSKVFGIYANEDSKVIATGICDDLDTVSSSTEKVKLDSTEYKTEGTLSAVDVYNFNGKSPAGNLNSYIDNSSVAPYSIKLIDNNDDGKIDRAVVVPFTVKKVTYVGATSLTVKDRGSIDKDDAVVEKDLAKDDYVMITEAANTSADKITLTKVTPVTGKVNAVKDTNTVQIDGTWYKMYTGANALTNSDVGSTVKLQVVNGYYFDSELTTAAADSSNVLYVSAADKYEAGLGDPYVTIKAYFTDGSSKKVNVVEVNDADVVSATGSGTTNGVYKLNDALPQTSAYNTTNHYVVEGMMYRYETNKDGDYELYALASTSSQSRAGYKTYAASTPDYNGTTDRLTVDRTSFIIADDAVIFVQAQNASTGDKVKTISGKALKNWDLRGVTLTDAYSAVLANDTNGAKTVKVASLIYKASTAISGASDDSYGYVTATPVRTTNSKGDKVWQYEIWNGKETLTVYEDVASTTIEKGDFVKYDIVSSEEVEKVTEIGTATAVTAIDGKYIDTTENTALKIDAEDTTVIYVNTKDVKGVEGGAIALADEPTTGNFTKNAVVYRTTGSIVNGDTLDVIFVDVNNSLDGIAYAATVPDAANQITSSGATYTLTVSPATAKEGDKLTLKVAVSGTTLSADYTLTVKCNETGEEKDVTFASGTTAGKSQNVTFAQKAYATTYSIVGGN